MSKVASVTDEGTAEGSDEGPQVSIQDLLDDLALLLADAARQGILLTSGPLSRRKTDWILARLAEQLGQAAQLVDRLKREA